MRSLVLAAAPVLALILSAPLMADDAAKIEKGKKVYEGATPKCKVCHSIGGVGNAKGALEGVSLKAKADDIKAWLRTPKEMTEKTKATRKPAMPAYPKEKLAEDDLEALTAYLLSLKK
jgi:mono/diheme cytochrome c family protein